ncbi:hypothetical protein DMB92_02060 [Campylobacter sp. MIT 99-7217]|uniref:hypothetical protein n=1 Tax=Campylobacter sp. MIT 99-7217 TaxID=535091 RepID=UPI00115A83B3|nr:hypothetical protein [Campylobacter sp. MIT 99-7217]TQR33694.1 hypothetical protein DMB92_02060 [Campylobacter sp. MIT 99-7217]
MPQKILDYIQKMRLLSWAMQDENGVYIANAFYAFDEENFAFIIASHENTKHIHLARLNPNIAINIAEDSFIATLKGLQIKASFKEANLKQTKIYHQKFPFAKLGNAKCFSLEMLYAKMTDNTSLKAKLQWQKDHF